MVNSSSVEEEEMASAVLTSTEAVRTFGMHPATVLRLILTGRVSAKKNSDGRWLIDRADLERWDKSRRRPKAKEQGHDAAA